MKVEDAIAIVEQVLDSGRLNKTQELVFRQAWEGQSYSEIARTFDYDSGYIKDTGSKLWQKLSAVYDRKITKRNFQSVLQQIAQHGRTQEFLGLETGIVQDQYRWSKSIFNDTINPEALVITKLRTLPPNRQEEVLNFIEFLQAKEQADDEPFVF